MPVTAVLYLAVFLWSIGACIAIDASWGVYLYELNYFVFPSNRWWSVYLPSFFDSLLISVTMLGAFLLRYSRYNRNRILDLPQAKWLFAFHLLMCIAGFYAVWPEIHSQYLSYQLKLIVIVLVSYKAIDTPIKFDRFIFFYLLGIFYIGWAAYSQGRTGAARIEGLGTIDGKNANDTAAAMITAIPFLVFHMIKGKNWQRFLAVVGFVFIVNGVILINSRGAFLGLVIGCTLMFIQLMLSRFLAVKEKFSIVLGIILSIGLFFYLADPNFWGRMSTLNEISSQVGSGETIGRMYYWFKTFDLVKQYPFGTGVSGYTFLSPQFLPPEMLTEGHRAVHSTYFQVLAEYGYLGLFIFTGILISCFGVIRKSKKKLLNYNKSALFCKILAIESSLVSYLVAITFIDRLYSVVLYWLFLIIACFYSVYVIPDTYAQKT